MTLQKAKRNDKNTDFYGDFSDKMMKREGNRLKSLAITVLPKRVKKQKKMLKKIEISHKNMLTLKLLEHLCSYHKQEGGIHMSLGDKLRNLRQRSKKTLQEQSEILGVSMNSIYRWEHDLAVPRKPILNAMAAYFDVPLEWLLSENTAASFVSDTEQKLLCMFRQLPDKSRYKVLGYVERMCVEEYGTEHTQ